MLKEELWIRLSYVPSMDYQKWEMIIFALEQTRHLIKMESDCVLSAQGLTKTDIYHFWLVSPKIISQVLKWISLADRYILPFHSQYYPSGLKHAFCPPLCLFCQGSIQVLKHPTLSIVGSRSPTGYGRRWAHYFADYLTNKSLVLTSGLAIGIDTIIHQTALQKQMATIAILGCGLNAIYPPKNQLLAEQIHATGGVLISPFLPNTLQLVQHFGIKNHLLATVGLGVLVIQAAMQSGSMMTARLALESSREIYTIPHPLGSVQSEGNHWLIQQGANLITSGDDLMLSLNSRLNWINLPK